MLTLRLKKLNLAPGDWVLDIGCGEGRHCHGIHMMEGINVIGLDMDTPSLNKARAGIEIIANEAGGTIDFLRGDAFNLPFPDHSFDAVICSEVLEHLPDYPRALSEFLRVLKPGKTLGVSVPHAWPERICWRLAPPPHGYAFDPGGHIRIFDDFALRQEIQTYGFSFEGKHHSHALHTPYWWLKTLFWNRSEDHLLVRAYHKILVWDMMKKPWVTRGLEWILNPLMGKSVALYFQAPK